MIVKMLEAVSEMLKDSKEIKVQCADTILKKVIEGMEKQPQLTITNTFVDPKPPNPPQKSQTLPEKRKAKEGEVEVVVDAGRIKAIKNAKDDTMIQLDGKAYHWKDAIGKEFNEGKIL